MNRRTFLLHAACVSIAGPALAQSSPVAKGSHSSLRLVAGETTAAGKRRFGIELTLAKGFKTYWRSPGDSGVPPVFDWSGSQNVEGLNVRWPVPERFFDGAGTSIGYVGDVVFPASVQPIDAGKPVVLALRLDYAICEKMCIPVKGEVGLSLPPGEAGPGSPTLRGFEARVPRPVDLGEAGDRIALLGVDIAKPPQAARLALAFRLPSGGEIADIFVEGPDMWAFGRPELSAGADGALNAVVPVIERPKGAAGPTPFIVTVAGRPGPIETRIELDIPAARP